MAKSLHIFTRPGCTACDRVKGELAGLGLAYAEHDVSPSADNVEAISLMSWIEYVDTLPLLAVLDENEHDYGHWDGDALALGLGEHKAEILETLKED